MRAKQANPYYVTKNGVVLEKNLSGLIKFREGGTPDKSVLKPPARTGKLWTDNTNTGNRLKSVVDGMLKDTKLSDDVKMVIELQMLTGCRISEALQVNHNDITNNGSIRLRGLKGSNNRYVTPVLYIRQWQKAKRSGLTPGRIYSRFYFYRLYVKRGLYLMYPGDNKRSVTHAFRKLRGDDYYKLNESLEDTKNSLGQRRLSSAIYYRHEKK